MSGVLEKHVVAATLAFSRKAGIAAIRYHAGKGVATGWPDYVFLIPGGRPLFIEFKRPGGVLTAMQKHRIKTLEELGYAACVCDSAPKAIAAIEARLKDEGSRVRRY